MSNSELDAQQAETSPGALLRSAREQAGLSLREVAGSLHCIPRQIEAIEQDRYDQLKGDIFCRGYIKGYAKLLALEPQPLLAAYDKLRQPSVEQKLQAAKSKIQNHDANKGRSIYYWSFAATLLVAVILWSYGSSSELDFSSDFPAASDEVVVDKNPLISDERIDLALSATSSDLIATTADATEVDAMVLTDAVAEQLDDQSLSTVDAQPLLAAASMELKADSENSEDVFIVSSNDDNSLNFIFEEDCWVEVKDRDNKVIFANLKRASESLTLSGKPPFKVLLGYAHGVRVNYNGEPVSFDVNQQNNAARLTIGRR
jgi:cytoskeleton protein RodZ